MKKKYITVADLSDQIGIVGPRPFLKCFVCGAEYSANRGDYFMRDGKYVFTCCKNPMKLVVKGVTFREVK